MKLLKITFAAVFAFAFGNAYAFHSGGVAECEGCHSMHNSLENKANVTGKPQFTGGPYLLKASDQSGACLNCHNQPDVAPTGYHISTDGSLVGPGLQGPIEQTPGGDFAWLKMTRPITIRGTASTYEADRSGHNIVAIDYLYTADKLNTAAPGGTYLAANLACSSCHDPHGKYRRLVDGTQATTGAPTYTSGSYGANPTAALAVGVYRLLGGPGYAPKSYPAVPFTAASPDAVAPSSYNGTNGTAQGTKDTVAYGRGMSEWCGNCHPKMHNDTYVSGNAAGTVHPAGNGAKLTPAIIANYVAYVSSGIMTGTGANYSAMAPFEYGVTDSLPATITTLAGYRTAPSAPNASSNVLCLSCHRAHASGFESMTRYNLANEFMTIADASGAPIYDPNTTENKINYGLTPAQQQNAYNGRPASVFGPYARDYCNKCHAKD